MRDLYGENFNYLKGKTEEHTRKCNLSHSCIERFNNRKMTILPKAAPILTTMERGAGKEPLISYSLQILCPRNIHAGNTEVIHRAYWCLYLFNICNNNGQCPMNLGEDVKGKWRWQEKERWKLCNYILITWKWGNTWVSKRDRRVNEYSNILVHSHMCTQAGVFLCIFCWPVKWTDTGSAFPIDFRSATVHGYRKVYRDSLPQDTSLACPFLSWSFRLAAAVDPGSITAEHLKLH